MLRDTSCSNKSIPGAGGSLSRDYSPSSIIAVTGATLQRATATAHHVSSSVFMAFGAMRRTYSNTCLTSALVGSTLILAMRYRLHVRRVNTLPVITGVVRLAIYRH